jgi:Raf kinase inhibitor-like YbhB/YbcL family protein
MISANAAVAVGATCGGSDRLRPRKKEAAMPEHSGEAITILKVDEREDIRQIVVTSPAQGVDGRLDDRCSAYHDNISPQLSWEPVDGAAAFAVVVEDPDAPREHPFVHWLIWNIPGAARGLPEGLPNEPQLITPQRAVQGRNDNGGYGWFGPMPPAGHGVHRYYFQVFALDQEIGMGPNTPLTELLHVLKASTIAKGEMMATYEAPTRQ